MTKAPLNPAFTGLQVTSALNHLGASHLIISAETNLPRKAPASNLPLLEHLQPDLESAKLASIAVPTLESVVVVDNSYGRVDLTKLKYIKPYRQVVEDGGIGRVIDQSNLSPEEIVNIQFTSGTTSMPKAACLTHRSILNNGKLIGDRMLLTHEDVICCPPPLYQYVNHCMTFIFILTEKAALGAF